MIVSFELEHALRDWYSKHTHANNLRDRITFFREYFRTQVIYIPLLQLRENKLITRVDQHISALPCRRLSKCNVSRKNWSRHSSTVVSRNHYCDYSMFVAYRQEHFQDIDHDTNVQSLLSPTSFLTIPWHTRVCVETTIQ